MKISISLIIFSCQLMFILGKSHAIGIVSIQNNRNHICSGVFIESNVVLTTGHCLTGHGSITNITVQVKQDKSDEPGKVYQAKEILVNPDYENAANDVGLIILKEKVELKNGKSSFFGNSKHWKSGRLGNNFITAAWGYTAERKFTDELAVAGVKLLDSQKCSEYFKSYTKTQNTLCGSSPKFEICRGDSGAPLLQTYEMKQHVIGLLLVGPADCTNNPILFVDVDYNVPWIVKTLKEMNLMTT